MNNLTQLAITGVIFFLIDIVWLTVVMGPLFGNLVRNIQGSPMILNPFAGLIAYLFLAVGTYYFGVRNVDPANPLLSSIISGGLFGLTAYGIFDFTNMAIFRDYSLPIALLDTAWGGFVSALVTYLSYLAISRLS